MASGLKWPNLHHTCNGEPFAAAAGSAAVVGLQKSAIGSQAVQLDSNEDKTGTAAAAKAEQTIQGSSGQQREQSHDASFLRDTAPAANGHTAPRSGCIEQGGAGTKRKAVDAAAAEEAGVAPKSRKPRLGGTVLVGEHSVKGV